MTDWKASMQQTFEYYTVDPGTWRDDKQIKNVKSCTINRDSEVETLGSATIELTESIGECYIRVYLIAIQNGVSEKHALGTFLAQSSPSNFDGKSHNVSIDAYTPLLELKEKQPPIGYSLLEKENIMSAAHRNTQENARAPVVMTENQKELYYDFVADPNDTWLSYNASLIANANHIYGLDEMGRILFLPKQDTASLQPVWTYDDSNSSILYPELTVNRDIYDIPNVVEVIFSNGIDSYYARVINDDPNSPISIVNRGREIPHRVTNPDLVGDPTESQIQEYAEQLLRELSTLECTITYTHGYCPVRLEDCVRFNYSRAGLTDVKAKVISQTIKCEPGCSVTEKAVFSTKLWG